MINDLEFHHIGLIVRDINDAIEHYCKLFGKENVSEVYSLESQKIKECFIRNGENSYIGLVSPVDKDSIIYALMKKGITYYHIAYKVLSLKMTILKMEELNYKLISVFSSEAFKNKECAFLYTPEGAIVELIEK
ncbi:MAG: VOC family protein [Bacteroidales bacterium]